MNHLRDALANTALGRELTRQSLESAFEDLLHPDTPPVLIASFLTALRLQGETATVLESAVGAVLNHALPFASADELGPVRLDTCGTGGDGAASINISTASAFVAAAAGVPVVKHGNRSATGRSGSSDVLEALGIRTDLPVDTLCQIYADLKFVFLFAPAFHPALKNLAPIRKQLPFRTVFNLVGPLASPARPTHQLLGVADHALAGLFAQVLQKSGVVRAAVISAQDGLDEVSTGAPTRALLVSPDATEELLWHPELTFGIAMHDIGGLRVESAEESARRIRAVFEGRAERPVDEAAILMNAAAGIWLAGFADSPMAGMDLARSVVKSGAVMDLLNRYRKFC
ncbi:MAG: anthranilate phosphoribosyltransferase [Isosphaeraceae bacterium]